MESDARSIVSFIQMYSDRQRLQYTIWALPGIVEYVRSRIATSEDNELYLVADETGTVTAVAQFRFIRDSLFVNHIYTDVSARGKGIGSSLLRTGITKMIGFGMVVDKVALDVAMCNARAYNWYRRLGFKEAEHQEWWLVKPVVPRSADCNWEYHESADAATDQERWGFSQIVISTNTRSYQVGRLGKDYFRLLGAEGVTDRALMTALHTLDPMRRLLIICGEGAFPCELTEASLVSTSIRMEAPVRKVLDSLK